MAAALERLYMCKSQAGVPQNDASCRPEVGEQPGPPAATIVAMFNENTTIILGAGASMPYGYPSGHRLITDILGLFALDNPRPAITDTPFADALRLTGITSEQAI